MIGELELAWRLIPNEFVAVTGTNGKTTTTELLGHIHREAGLPVAVAGNVGTAVASLVGALDPDATVVCEASSFQLEDTEAFAPEAAVLLNVTEDHLDRHGTLEAYVAAKLQAFARQGNDDVAVCPCGARDRGPRRLRAARVLRHRARRRSSPTAPASCGGPTSRCSPSTRSACAAPHNRRNAMAAAAVALARGIDPDAVRAGLRTFAGVAHRLEEVAERDGVLYVNDSKATNVASTLVALASFEGGVHLILGGRGKGAGLRAAARRRSPSAARPCT